MSTSFLFKKCQFQASPLSLATELLKANLKARSMLESSTMVSPKNGHWVKDIVHLGEALF